MNHLGFENDFFFIRHRHLIRSHSPRLGGTGTPLYSLPNIDPKEEERERERDTTQPLVEWCEIMSPRRLPYMSQSMGGRWKVLQTFTPHNK